MRTFLLSIFMVSALWLRPVEAEERPELRAVIGAQIEAFKRDDFAAAFAFASPNIRRIFQNPERFGEMVRGGYAMVWRPRSVEYGPARVIAGRLWQSVLVRGPDGVLHQLDYEMVEVDEAWRINAVQLLPSPEVMS